ncbi:hypothetical protein K438DRAFT_809294 [Mycena galopus ATCC 62051]|nr:hypothetical protein K438DRAFT_809294 [Mycena galopus ATCC 62051]
MAAPLSTGIIVLMVASWVNVSLYTVELVLCGQYFMRPGRLLVYRIAAGIMIIADTTCTLATSVNVCLTVLGTPLTSFPLVIVPITVAIFATAISSAVTQLFLCQLFYALTKNRLVTGALLVMIFVHFGFTWSSAILSLTSEGVGSIVATTNSVGAAICAATDVIIATALGWTFWRMMEQSSPERKAGSLIRRILILAVSSGAICAGNTLLVTLFLLTSNPAFFFFCTFQGRVYALTFLGNFLVGIPGAARDLDKTTAGQWRQTNVNLSTVVFRVSDDAAALPQPNSYPTTNTSKAAPAHKRMTSTTSLARTNHVRASLQLEVLALGSVHRESDLE